MVTLWKRFFGGVLVVASAMLLLPAVAGASIIANQIDTFSDGTIQNWSNGAGAPDPLNIATGGPAGLGDHFLQVSSSGGGGPDSHLSTFNTNQWLGNYTAAGVTFVEMDFKNFGATELSMRIALKLSTAKTGPGVASNAFLLPADGQWHHAVFPLDASHLNVVGATTQSAVLANVVDFRINESAGVSLIGDVIAAQVGVDNIHAGVAAAVPEPSSLLLGGACVFGFGAAAIRRRRLAAAPAPAQEPPVT